MIKKSYLLMLSAFLFIGAHAQSIKGPESIDYFQAPAEGVKFESADVFVSNDDELAKVKKEEQQARNSAMGASFGSVGAATASAVNSGMDAMETFNKLLDKYKDKEGRFATWNFVPKYIVAPAETKKALKVEIFVLNEPDPSPSARMPTSPDKNGYYDVPYYVNCRYKVTDAEGKVILEENLGIIHGKQKTKRYTPPPASPSGVSLESAAKSAAKDAMDGELEDEVPIQDQIGTNVAYNRVRKEVFSRYGFGQFSAPIKLGVIKEHKASKKMISPTIDIFANKKGLLLNKEEKAAVQAFATQMEDALKVASEKTKWVALHNLSVCYAWLEDAEKAQNYYKQYGEEIKSTLDKVECWNLILQKKMTSKEMKEKVGTTFIGTKDLKSYAEYSNIKSFVNYYPQGAKTYPKLMTAINRDLKRFVDFYAVNDLLCQLFEIDYPYEFLPLKDLKGSPKDMKATITKEGNEAVEYRVKYDMQRKIKELQADQLSYKEDGSKEKLETRDIMPKYNEGMYSHLETDAGIFAAEMGSSWRYQSLNYVHDPIEWKTNGLAENITKNIGIFGGKASSEKVILKVDLEGNILFSGTSDFFKVNPFFKEILDGNGIVPKRADTHSDFNVKVNINENDAISQWSCDSKVKTQFGGVAEMRKQSISADKQLREINFEEVDDKGNPTKISYNYTIKGKMDIQAKVPAKAVFAAMKNWEDAPVGKISSDSFDVATKGVWNCTFEYDENGNWTKMIVGPYTAIREFKY